MKVRTNPLNLATGHVLWMVLVCTALIGLALVGYLKLTQTRTTLTARSQVWNNCMPILEAGIEEALAQLNRYGNSNLTDNGWTAVGGGFYKERPMGSGYYRVTVSYTNLSFPTILSTGYLPAPPTLASARPWLVAQSVPPTPTISYISRSVRVTCQRQPLLGKALVAKTAINLNGNNIFTDSYESCNPLYSGPQGQYDPTKAKANGDVAINSGNLVNVGSLGNADIAGTVHVGPSANLDLGPNGSVGDAAWVAGANGIQTNHYRTDANFLLPDVSPPWAAGTQPAPLSAPGVKYLLGNGRFEMNSLTVLPAETMQITGNAVLYVKGNVDIRGQFEIVAPGSLTMYVGGASAVFGGTLVKPPLPKDFVYYGLPSNTAVDIKCSGMPFNGVIYAPEAAIRVISQSSVSGSIVGNTLTFVGNSAFHYDECLANLAYTGFVIASWEEI